MSLIKLSVQSYIDELYKQKTLFFTPASCEGLKDKQVHILSVQEVVLYSKLLYKMGNSAIINYYIIDNRTYSRT